MTHLVPLDGVSGRRVGLAAGGRRYGVPETEFTGRCQARIVGPGLGDAVRSRRPEQKSIRNREYKGNISKTGKRTQEGEVLQQAQESNET